MKIGVIFGKLFCLETFSFCGKKGRGIDRLSISLVSGGGGEHHPRSIINQVEAAAVDDVLGRVKK